MRNNVVSMRVTALFLLSLSVPALKIDSALHADVSGKSWSQNPVGRVVKLLRDMHKQLGKEAREGEEMFEKTSCWCETNDKMKTKAIVMANQRITDKEALREGSIAKSAELESDIGSLQQELADKATAAAQALELREREAGEFLTAEKDMVQTLGSLKSAIATLSSAHGGSSFSQASLTQVRNMLKQHLQKWRDMFSKKAAPLPDYDGSSPPLSDVGFMSLLQQPGSYSPQSGAIFGFLKQMRETFEANLASGRKEEASAKEQYEQLKASSTSEAVASQKMVFTKTTELADAKQKAAQAKEDLKDTAAALAADTTFLQNLKLRCAAAHQKWEAIQKTRVEEVKAISEAIQILSEDDAQATFDRSLGFPQLNAHRAHVVRAEKSLRSKAARAEKSLRSKAARVLSKVARSSSRKNLRLLRLVASIQNDGLEKMVGNIDGLVAELKTQQEDDVHHRDLCIEELTANERSHTKKGQSKEDLEQKAADLNGSLEELRESTDSLKQEVMDMQIEMKKASLNREKEGKDFQLSVADARATQTILANALQRLKSFYEERNAAALVQAARSSSSAQDELRQRLQVLQPAVQSYEKSGKAPGVMGLLEMIIGNAKRVEAEATDSESEAQQAYEEFMKDADASIHAIAKDITSKSSQMAYAEEDYVEAQSDLKHATRGIDRLENFETHLHNDCDFLMDNFKESQSKRAEEVEALQSSKTMFAHMKML